MNNILTFLTEVKLTEEQAIAVITAYLEQKRKKKELAQKYYAKNKEKLDKKHREYRVKNPVYRSKGTERTRKNRR